MYRYTTQTVFSRVPSAGTVFTRFFFCYYYYHYRFPRLLRSVRSPLSPTPLPHTVFNAHAPVVFRPKSRGAFFFKKKRVSSFSVSCKRDDFTRRRLTISVKYEHVTRGIARRPFNRHRVHTTTETVFCRRS